MTLQFDTEMKNTVGKRCRNRAAGLEFNISEADMHGWRNEQLHGFCKATTDCFLEPKSRRAMPSSRRNSS